MIPQRNDKQNGEQDRSERAAQSKNRELVQRDANGSTDGQAHKPGRDHEQQVTGIASLHGKVIAPSAEREKRHE
jgi:hypothetical protein